MSAVLGIDLGTTYTAAARWDGSRPEVVQLGAHGAAIPSVVYVGETTFAVGERAAALGAGHPERLVSEFKRQLGDESPILAGDRFVTADELQTELARFVYGRAVELEGLEPERVVFTVPAHWGGYRRDRVLELATSVVGDPRRCQLVSEPEAAAVYYATRDRVPAGSVVGVYDFGGGTFDAAMLRRLPDGFELLGRPAGDDNLGGIDLDAVLLDHVADVAGISWPELDREDPAVMRGIAQLRAGVTLAKELLSSELTADVVIALPGTTTTVLVNRRGLEDLVRPLIERTLTTFDRGLAYAGVAPADLHSILLVGGASRMPLVGEMLTERYRAPLAADAHPKFAVALGAAILAAPVGVVASGRTEAPPAPAAPDTIETPVVPLAAAVPAEPETPAPLESVEAATEAEVHEHPAIAEPTVPRASAAPTSGRARRNRVMIGVGGLLVVGVAVAAAVSAGGNGSTSDSSATTTTALVATTVVVPATATVTSTVTTPAIGQLTGFPVSNPVTCDGTPAVVVLHGATPGESFTATVGTDVWPFPPTAASDGSVSFEWACSPQQAGTTWDIRLTGSSSGRLATFAIVGNAPGAAIAPSTTARPTPATNRPGSPQTTTGGPTTTADTATTPAAPPVVNTTVPPDTTAPPAPTTQPPAPTTTRPPPVT